jgi:hypothetical protein
MATRSQLRSRIQAQFDNPHTTRITATDWNNWIQDCHDELAHHTKYYKRYATANIEGASTAQHEFNVSTLRMVEIDQVTRLGDGETTYKVLRIMPWHVYRRYSEGQDTTTAYGLTGTPTHYCWHGDSLYLYPAANYDEDDGIKIWFSGCQTFKTSSNTEAEADATESTLPRQFQDSVVWYGVWRGKARLQDLAGAEYYRRMYEAGKAKLRDWASSLRTVGPDRIPRWDEVRQGGMDSRL